MLTVDQIKQAIELYLKRSYTEYAVLIDGSWGVGKTYLLEQVLLPSMQDIRFIHISLYGLSTIADIENEIYKSAFLDDELSDTVFSGQEHLSSDMLRGARLGGVSYAVQFLVNRYHARHENSAFKLVFSFDDLERWAGDFNVCMSYINKIVEQEKIKCILMGNLDALDEDGLMNLVRAREKTIRHIYKFENPTDQIIKIALGLVDYQCEQSRRFIHAMVEQNMASLVSFLAGVGERNIRTVSEALQLYEYILTNNIEAFKCCEPLAYTYFRTLLSTLILLKKYFLHKEEREELFEGNYRAGNGLVILKKIGYFDQDSPEYITDESRLLLDTIFSRLDEISLEGVFSIINNGFYIERDFDGSFERWQNEKFYEDYLDSYSFYQLEEDRANEIVERVIAALFDQRAITNPATLLLLAERLLNDINKDVIDLGFERTNQKFVELIRELYENHQMDLVELEHLKLQIDRYPHSDNLLALTLTLNDEYIKSNKIKHRIDFWQRLANEPDNIMSMLEEFEDFSFLNQTRDAQNAVTALEKLNNAQLYQLAQGLKEKMREQGQSDGVTVHSRIVDLIAEQIHHKYKKKYGIRAANMQDIATILQRINTAVS